VELATAEAKEETTHSLCVGALRAPATSGYLLCVNGRNGDTLVGYSGQALLKREECGIFSQSKNYGAREKAIAK
jgi:hypothetical protein